MPITLYFTYQIHHLGWFAEEDPHEWAVCGQCWKDFALGSEDRLRTIRETDSISAALMQDSAVGFALFSDHVPQLPGTVPDAPGGRQGLLQAGNLA